MINKYGFHYLFQLNLFQTQFDALEGKLVLDAGSGPGALAIGAALLGAGAVLALDLDGDALAVLRDNLDDFEVSTVDPVHCDFLEANVMRYLNLQH